MENEVMDGGIRIKRKLREEGYRFNFFKAVHLLELFGGGCCPGTGLSPEKDPVHFCVKPGFSFPASDIEGIRTNGNGAPPKMAVNFMGLVGPKGVLPDWYNSHAFDCRQKKDHAFSDFLDLFHHRLLSLFYRAWKKYRLVENFRADGSDAISGVLGRLAGAGHRERRAHPRFFGHARHRLIHFCGLVSRTVPTVAAVETLIGHAVGAPVRVEQFVERVLRVHRQDRTRLGRRNCTLKENALCGGKMHDAGSFFRVHIGPLAWKRYLAFCPGSRNLQMVQELVAYLVGIEYEFDMRLVIRRQEIPALKLGDDARGPQLGRTATLKRPHRPHPKDIVVTAACRGILRQPA
jgi:type VI secretion system protein ImpH